MPTQTQHSLFDHIPDEVWHDEPDSGGLDRFYTPFPLAKAILEDAKSQFPDAWAPVFVEPSVGGGAWAWAARELWPSCVIIGVDIDPDADGLNMVDEPHVGDWLEVAERILNRTYRINKGFTWCIGNLPFSEQAAHWSWCMRVAPRTTVICNGIWPTTLDYREVVDTAGAGIRHRTEPNPRADFVGGKGNYQAPTPGITWERGHRGPGTYNQVRWRGRKR